MKEHTAMGDIAQPQQYGKVGLHVLLLFSLPTVASLSIRILMTPSSQRNKVR